MRVNGARLRSTLEEMARIGATPGGGVSRLALSDEDKEARDLLVKWLKEMDLEVMIDQMGSIFGQRSGSQPELAPVMTGSHLDSQPTGGRFDGVLGVMGGLEALRTIHENNIPTPRGLILVDWTNEEGSRFAPAMVASGVWAGVLDRDWAYARTDRRGLSLGGELERIGYQGSLPVQKWPIHAYWEYHIEQGPVLESLHKTIGAPKGIVCVHWYDIHLQGTANQVGPTPMEGRNDALVAAAEMVVEVNSLPAKMGGQMVATVGEINNQPNSRNIIPDAVHFTVDLRSWDNDLCLAAWEELKKAFEAVAAKHGCPISAEETWRVEPASFDPKLVNLVLDAAGELNYSSHYMVSGAGHDASYMNHLAPTAMIFVPSKGGRSHVEVEETAWEDCEAGANVLLHCLLTSALEV